MFESWNAGADQSVGRLAGRARRAGLNRFKLSKSSKRPGLTVSNVRKDEETAGHEAGAAIPSLHSPFLLTPPPLIFTHPSQ